MKVINRKNIPVSYNPARIKAMIESCTIGLTNEINPLELETLITTRVIDGITTTQEIQNNLIDAAITLATSPESSAWLRVAGRLNLRDLKQQIDAERPKECQNSLTEVIQYQSKIGNYDDGILLYYAYDDLEDFNNKIIEYENKYDSLFDYAGSQVLRKRYLLHHEKPQEMFKLCALWLAAKTKNPVEKAIEIYHAIASLKISLATPFLSNLRTNTPNLSSCFITTVDDNLESITKMLAGIANISKQGGGVGINLSRIRSRGASVAGVSGASGGVTPWIKLINDMMVAVSQVKSSRLGAATVAIEVWHKDIYDFLELQTENGDLRKKAYDIFPQIVVNDLFMECVRNDRGWFLFDPHDLQKAGIDLCGTFGQTWCKNYEKAIVTIPSERITIVSAKDLMKFIMRTQIETGLPYLFFKDTVNISNVNSHAGIIPNANLCVSPETKILTDKGHFAIADLAGQKATIWNGFEWSEVDVVQTGTDQPLLKVNFSNGESLECTYYHHFWVQDNYRSKPRKVEAKDLQIGDKLIKYNLPLVESDSDIDFPYAYTHGAFCGDGSYGNKGMPEIDLYGEKHALISHLEIRNKLHGSKWGTTELDSIAVYNDVNQGRLVCKLPLDIAPKFYVPLTGFTVKSRLEWLAGLLDTDGTVARNGSNDSLQISSIHKNFLLEVRLLLQTLGVDSKVTQMADERATLLPDGKGGQKEYNCKTSYRLLISSNGLFQLGQLGLTTNRLKWTLREPQRDATQFIKVTDIELTCRRDDTFCFTEPKRHLGMFNGILTGQCTESYSNVSDSETHCCNLISLNLARLLEEKEWKSISTLAVEILDNALELTHCPTIEAKNHNEKYRTIGIGFMGLADYLAWHKLSYSVANVNPIFQPFLEYVVLASSEIARQKGVYPAYNEENWLSWLSTRVSKAVYDTVKEHGVAHGQLLAIAPNTSSSLIGGCTASILPTYDLLFSNKDGQGTLPIAVPYAYDRQWFYQTGKTLEQDDLISVIAAIQQYIDQGISMELIHDLNSPTFTAKKMYNTIHHAWQSGCKAIYYTRTIQKSTISDKTECTSCAN
jgi:ribonucleoside-diphosphate reductase alpha chain